MEDPAATGITELELLRAKDDSLHKQIISVGWVRMITLIVCWYLLSAASNKAADPSIQSVVDALSQQQTEMKISDPLDPFTLRYRKATTDSSFTRLEVKKGVPYTDQQRKLLDLRYQLATKYRDAYVVKLTALGTDISVDIRTVVLTTPIWLPLLQIYVFVLKEKRKIVRAIARGIIGRAPPDQRFVIDQISFLSPKSAFLMYPEVFADRIFYSAAVIWFIRSIVEFGRSVENAASKAQSKIALAILIQCLIASLIYSSAYASGIGQRMRAEASELLGEPIAPDAWSRFWTRLERLGIYLTSKADFRKLLLSGSIAVIASLFLSTAVVGCDARPHLSSPKDIGKPHSRLADEPGVKMGDPLPGYRLLSDLADWPIAVKAAQRSAMLSESTTQDAFGRYLYRYFILISIFSLGICLAGSFSERIPVFLIRSIRKLCVLGSVYEICELSSAFFLRDLTWLIVFLISFGILVSLRPRRHPAAAMRRRRRLTIALIPLVIADLLCLGSIVWVIPGFLSFFFGAHLLTLGIWNFEGRLSHDKSRRDETIPQIEISLPVASQGGIS
jgi:hypothetical protein